VGIVRHPTEEQFVLHHYRELEAAETAAVESHLGGCEGCRRRLAALERELAAVTPVPVPERPADYGTRVWARLHPRLAAERVSGPARVSWWRFQLPAIGPLAYAAGVAVLVLAAFVAGRYWTRQPASQQAAAPAAGRAATPVSPELVRARILELEVGEHLERSQAALLEVMNAPDAEGAIDLSNDQERVRDLVAENRLYRLTAVDAGENGMAAVLDELERTLVEIANSPSHVSGTEFERVRGEIDAQGLIFKVGVLGDSLRRKQAKASI
jgi:hypothetical protein